MDTTSTAGQQPAAAQTRQSEADAFLAADGGFDQSVSRDQAPREQQAPPAESAPVQSDAPVSQQQQVSTEIVADAATAGAEQQAATPVVDAELARQQAEFDRIRRERDQYAQENARWQQAQLALAQREQMRQIEQARADRVSQAHAVAENMIRSGDVEGGLAYIRRFEDETRVADWQAAQAQIANQRVQSEQQVHRALAPRYAEHLVKSNGLPDSYVALLSQYDGNQQDAMLPHLVAQHRQSTQQQTAREIELEQRLRDIEAQQKAMNPAFNPGGGGGAATPNQGQRPSNPREAELWDYLNAPPITR